MMDSYLLEMLESQRKFEKEPCSKIMEEYKCENCKAISKDLVVHKVIFDEETYRKIYELIDIVDKHNKIVSEQNKDVIKQNKPFLQKLFSQPTDSLNCKECKE